MDKLQTIIQPIQKEFELFQAMHSSLEINTNPLLKEIFIHVCKHGGKRMRPVLVLLFAKLFGNPNQATYQSAVALELLHTASLVHDDVVDESMQRRGQASINAVYNNKIAVLVGDYMLSTSLVYTGKTQNHAIIHVVSSLGQILADGEIYQMFHSHEMLVSEEIYYDIIRKKTASLFSACAEIGALSVNASAEEVAIAKKFGEYVGICFQIRDDIFDYFKDETIGKPTGNDLREGKLTLPIIYAIHTAGSPVVEEQIKRLKANLLPDAEISGLIDFAKQNGGIEYAQKKMDDYRAKALALLPAEMNADLRHSFEGYINYVVERNQ